MAQCVRVLAGKLDDPNSIPRTNMEGRENQFL